MPSLPQNLLTQLVSIPHESELKQAFLVAKDLAPGETVPWMEGPSGSPEIAFQYWPESVQDSRESTWNPRSIPGGSHPIYQWTHGGERRISFTAVFSTDTEPLGGSPTPSGGTRSTTTAYGTVGLGDQGVSAGLSLGKRDLDLRVVVSWLRYFTYPLYGGGESAEDVRVFEPPKVMLVMPNTGLSHNGSDHITTIMTQCEVTYEEWFPNGYPRIIEVQLEFAETVQENGGVRFHSRRDMARLGGQIATYLAKKST